MAPARSHADFAGALTLAIVAIGFFATAPVPKDEIPAPPFDVPNPGFRTMPGVRERGSGWPRDALRLRVTAVRRGDAERNLPDCAVIDLVLEESDGTEFSGDRWCMKDPDVISVPDIDGAQAWAYSFSSSFFEELNDFGGFTVTVAPLPRDLGSIPRLVVDVPVTPVLGTGNLRWHVRRNAGLAVSFLDDLLFAGCDGESFCWGSESHARFGRRAKAETSLQGRLDSYEVRDALGEPITASMTGRSWGRTYVAFGDPPPRFPIRVDARWRRCAPTAICRFVLEDVAIPAK